MVHTLRLDNYFPTPRKLVLGTNSSFGTESIKIERGAGWDGLNLTATWHIPGREEPLRVALLDGDAMDVPPEVTKEAKDGVLVLAGLASGVQRASCNVEYLILEQAGVYGGADAEPTPELAAQVLKVALQAKADAEAAAEDAAAAKANADKAQQAAENAAADAAKAGPYAEAARAAQEAAEAARDEAIAAQRAAENAAAAAAASKSAADTLAAEAARAALAAENSKTTANNAANFAGENATAAQQAAATATAAANDAGQSASDAAASKATAETAAKAAKDAQTAAAAAKAEAVKAQEASQTAAKSAQDAQAAAEKARDEAKAAQKGAEAARDAAAKSAEAAAKSEANAKQSADTLAESVENVVANTAAVAELKQQVKNITPDDSTIGGKPWSSKHIIDMLCPPLEESGNPVMCYPVAGYPLGIKAKWEPMQEGSGTPSPENIRPIKGRDRVTVTRCGENLSTTEGLDGVGWASTYEDLLDVLNKLPVGTYVLDFTFTLEKFYDHYTSDTAESNAFRINSKFDDGTPCIVTEGETITKAEKLPSVRKITETFVITPQHKGRVATAYFYACGRGDAIDGAPNGTLGEGKISNVTITLGTTAPTTYTPYTGQTNTLTLPETVYGGEVDAASGEGQETWKIIDLANANISLYGINQHGIANFSLVANLNNIYTTPGRAGYFTSSLPQDTATFNNATKIGIMKANASTFYIRLKETDANNEEAAKEYLASINAKLVYELAKPVPFTATGAQPLPALSGTNTVLTDADSATVTGRADPIKRITDLEDAVASQT